MRKLLFALVAVGSVLVAGIAWASTTTVTITKLGYVPNAVTIAQGGSVQFTNADTVAHQVVFKKMTGVTCSPAPLVLQLTQSGTCVFAAGGSFAYSDPNSKGNTYRGTVTVTAAAVVLNLSAVPPAVVYGTHVTLSGSLSTHTSGETVDIFAQPCGASAATKTTTVQTTTNGAFTAIVQPLMNTIYTAKVANTTSNASAVSVKPKLRLAKVAPHRYSLRVTAAQSLAGKYATFQRYNGTRWVAVKSVLLRANTTGVAPTVISAKTFRSTIKTGLHVRVVIGQAQVGTCYRPGRSNTIRS